MLLKLVLTILNLLIEWYCTPRTANRVKLVLTVVSASLALYEAVTGQYVMTTVVAAVITWLKALYDGYYKW